MRPVHPGRARAEIERRITGARPTPFDRRRSHLIAVLLPLLGGAGAWAGSAYGHLGAAAGALPALIIGTLWAAWDRKRPIYWRVELGACDVITATRHGSTLVLDVVPQDEQHTMLGVKGKARHRSRIANPAPRAVALAGLEHESEERRSQLLERAREWLSGKIVNVTIDAHWVPDHRGRLERAVIDAVSIDDGAYLYTDLPGELGGTSGMLQTGEPVSREREDESRTIRPE